MNNNQQAPSRWKPYTPVIYAVLAYMVADIFFDNRWLSIAIACAGGIISSELRRVLFERKRPFSELDLAAIIPILILLVVSIAMLIVDWL